MSELSAVRNGRATSGQIYRIAKNFKNGKFLKPAITYLDEKKMERKLKRSLDGGADSQAIKWGNFMEARLFEKLGLEWSMTSKLTLKHPKEKFESVWCGTPDLIGESVKKVGEIKCYQLKHFCQIVDVFNRFNSGEITESEAIEILKVQEPEIYWQTVSNAMILGFETGEMIVYAPNETEIEEIRNDILQAIDAVEDENKPLNILDPWKYKFIVDSPNNDLAVLPDDCEYESINTFEFKIPTEDKVHLTKAMIEAKKYLEDEI